MNEWKITKYEKMRLSENSSKNGWIDGFEKPSN